ncbi:MAG: hypothetical protein HOP35_15245 [Nitrospira sp.]|nr:hypothetical protein [Nitrospira sp.]
MIELGEAVAVCALARGFGVGLSCMSSQTSKGHDEAVAKEAPGAIERVGSSPDRHSPTD